MTGDSGHSWSIDSIEEGMARIEEDGGRMLTVPAAMLPAGAKEGQLLRVTLSKGPGGEAVATRITIDHAATAAALRKSAATTAEAMKNSAKHDPGGDVIL
ncbi:hypothetical protein BH11GEM1_BH11GEM1_02700 [soil metagenome]